MIRRAPAPLLAPLLAMLFAMLPAAALAQRGGSPAPSDARAGAPIDITGQWVPLITEDWRWRMITPPVGDYISVPLNPAGVARTLAWDQAADRAAGRECLPYGPGGLLRLPVRVRFDWADGNTLQLQTDEGQQVRLFHFIAPAPGGLLPALARPAPDGAPPSLQGHTLAQWHAYPQARGLGFGGGGTSGGALRAVTTNTSGGYLRRNGVPYSAAAIITEQFNVVPMPGDGALLVLTTSVEDPTYLAEAFVVSTTFRKETDLSHWTPGSCHSDDPLEPPVSGGRAR